MRITSARDFLFKRCGLRALVGSAGILALIFAVSAVPVRGQQPFVTIAGDVKHAAWWVVAEFHPFTSEVRGIPVSKIRESWCKATEFRKELIPRTLLFENGVDGMKASGAAFAVEGYFDNSGKKQTALVGVYQECSGEKGRFILVLDQPRGSDPPKVRFVNATPTAHQFGALSIGKDNSIAAWSCMECDGISLLKWDARKHQFAWVPDSED